MPPAAKSLQLEQMPQPDSPNRTNQERERETQIQNRIERRESSMYLRKSSYLTWPSRSRLQARRSACVVLRDGGGGDAHPWIWISLPPANHSNNRSVKLVGGEAVTDGGGEGGAEEVPVGFVADDRPAAMGCLGWGGGRVARI
jgi:hypothetical protein